MKYIKIILMTLLVLVLPSSCIKEDFDDCDNVTIYFNIWPTVTRTYCTNI